MSAGRLLFLRCQLLSRKPFLSKTTSARYLTSWSSPQPSPARIIECAPKRIQPYLRLIRLHQPTGVLLLLWPSAWGLTLATPAGHLPDPKLVAIFTAGSFFMRGAGCIINDLWDRKYDRQVERTVNRPLASGELNPTQAVALLAGFLSGSLACLSLLNPTTIAIGVTAIAPTIAYPLAKRFTYWPQLLLGMTMNYGAIMGYTAAVSEISLMAIAPLYVSAVFWTLIYDTIYAHQDKEDDSKIGVKSTALRFQDQTKIWLGLFATGMISNLTLAGMATNQSWPFYAAVLATSGQLAWQISTLNINDRADCWKKFNSNSFVGLIILVGLLTGTLVKE